MSDNIMSKKRAELIDYNVGQGNFCFIQCINYLHKKRLAGFFHELGFMIEFGLESIENVFDLDCEKLIILSFSKDWDFYHKYITYNIKSSSKKIYIIIENVKQSKDFMLKYGNIKNLKPFVFHKVLKKEEEIIDLLYEKFNLKNKPSDK